MNTDRPIRLMLIDDHEVVREGIEAMLAVEKDIEVVASVGSGNEALAAMSNAAPEVVLLDMRMPNQDGLEVLGLLLAANRGLSVLILSSADGDESIFRALKAGAVGYLLKNTSRPARLISSPSKTPSRLTTPACRGNPASETPICVNFKKRGNCCASLS